MNERINELAKQATYTVKGANGCVWGDNVNLEKFAELIGLECMYVGRLAQINNQLVDTEIKEYFGVKE
jgi:hypothetical protein